MSVSAPPAPQVPQAPPAWLVPLAGPALPPVELPAKPGGVTVGRHEACDVRLAADKVSRQHARLSCNAGAWRIADLQSRWGTYLNGVKVEPTGPDMPLSEGDFVRITPWTFSFSTKGGTRRGLRTSDDAEQMQTMVRAIGADVAQPLAEDMLTLLLESAAAVHSAVDEKALGEIVLDAAVRGTGMPNAALLRPLDAAGTVEVIAARRDPADEGSAIFSRSLLATASTGVVAELSGNRDAENISSSIVQMKIDTALCIPLMLGQTVAAYLYLDSRAGTRPSHRRLRPNAAAFCTALGRMASLALANLKRIDMERRQARMELELSAAAAAQRWIFPKRENAVCGFTVTGESRPGAYVGGDFFDVIVLSDTKLAVALGDVTGHGIAASVLMTAAQGFLHAALQEHAEPARAVNDLNQFVNPRRSDEKFVTLWVGVFDAQARTLSYVDAGHGYAMMLNPDGTFTLLAEGDGLPIGLYADADYKAIAQPLAPDGRALVISDGIVEQYGLVTGPDGAPTNEHFNVKGVEQVITSTPAGADPVTCLFEAVIKHAGTTTLQDDATAVLVKW